MVAALLIISRHEWGSRAAHPTQGRVGVGVGGLGISPCVCLPGRGGYFGLLYLCSLLLDLASLLFCLEAEHRLARLDHSINQSINHQTTNESNNQGINKSTNHSSISQLIDWVMID